MAEFWDWFSDVHLDFFETIEDGRCADLQTQTNEAVQRMFPNFGWVYGVGDPAKGGHSLTITGEGIIHQQLLTDYWASQAPDLPGWTFYPARQPGKFDGKLVFNGDQEFEFNALWVTPRVNEERELIDLFLWHPLFDQIDQKTNVMFIILDEALGEFGVDMWVGKIEITDEKLADSMPLAELKSFIEEEFESRGWEAHPPCQSYTSYSNNEPSDHFLRADVFAGTTRNFMLIREFAEADGQMEDLIPDTGAEFVFITIDSKILPSGEEIAFRGSIEDKLEERLKADLSGDLLGGASGTNYSYIDLVIYDGDRSLKLIHETLVEKQLPSGTSIHFFAKGNEARRIVL